jgi:hypothetical protein
MNSRELYKICLRALQVLLRCVILCLLLPRKDLSLRNTYETAVVVIKERIYEGSYSG